MKSGVLYVGLVIAVVFFAVKIFTAQLENKIEILTVQDQINFIYRQKVSQVSSQALRKR